MIHGEPLSWPCGVSGECWTQLVIIDQMALLLTDVGKWIMIESFLMKSKRLPAPKSSNRSNHNQRNGSQPLFSVERNGFAGTTDSHRWWRPNHPHHGPAHEKGGLCGLRLLLSNLQPRVRSQLGTCPNLLTDFHLVKPRSLICVSIFKKLVLLTQSPYPKFDRLRTSAEIVGFMPQIKASKHHLCSDIFKDIRYIYLVSLFQL